MYVLSLIKTYVGSNQGRDVNVNTYLGAHALHADSKFLESRDNMSPLISISPWI